eukprot:TRINITY_DN14389_c0_g1_i1.p1 TRINITY_DN14389_c0_g1~~TRINITY_DN14389_c0_g1_i1.p1  ORF type:complete len:195 (-),score=27.93 TRINITY_DN14389_c0_g1_i1:327-911(-)
MPLGSNVIRHQLSDWREIILLTKSLLIWEENYYIGIIVGIVSGIYSYIWLFEPTVLTLFSLFGTIIVTADYFVPRIMSQIFDEHLVWTGEKEKKYEVICDEIAAFFDSIRYLYSFLSYVKEKWPLSHFILTAMTLISLSWLGNNLNNVFLFYIWTLSLSLLPGLSYKGFIRKYVAWALLKFAELIKSKDQSKKD